MLFRVLNYIVSRRKIVAWFTIFVFIVSLIYVFVAHPKYSVDALLMPPAEGGGEGIISAWMASLNLPSLVTSVAPSSTTAQVFADILGSRRVAEMIIDELDLKKRFKVETMEDAVKELRARTKIKVTQTGLIRLKVRDKDPELAVGIAEHYIAGLDSLNRYLSLSRAVRTRKFIASQLEKYGRNLDSLRARIADFQKRNGIVDIGEQVRGAIDLATEVKLRAVLAGIEKQLLEEFAKESSVELKRKRAEYRFLNEQLARIMNGGSESEVFLPLRNLPDLQKKFAEMQRDLEVSEQVYSFLLQRYEEAGIDAAKDTPTIQVVDEPRLPEEPSGLSRPLFVILATFAGFLWISLVLAVAAWMEFKDKDPGEEEAFSELKQYVSDVLIPLRRFLKI